MNTRSFNVVVSIALLVTFIGTPSLVSAQTPGGGLGGMNPAMLLLLMQGGRSGLGGGGSGGGGGVAQIGQFLALAGLLSGNMGLAMAGLLTSMLGGLSGAGGQGSTPQTGKVDEQYVAPGQAGPNGVAGNANSPYYATPSPSASVAPTASCSQSIFIVKDTTATPVTTKPYPTSITIPQTDCALVINTDTVSHSLSSNTVDAQTSKIFRFGTKKVYNMCIDASASACTAVTVQ
ncbi:MAG: hypothetical protein ABIP54_03520 [Candidatus Andersenbacteria bacterium]